MDPQVAMMIMQTCQHFAEKVCNHPLTEYEAQMYESLARCVYVYGKCQKLALESCQRKLEIEDIEERIKHNQKLKELGQPTEE